MNPTHQIFAAVALCAIALAASTFPAIAATLPAQLPAPDGKPGNTDKPVKLYIHSGQSNMVGMGQVVSRSNRKDKQFTEPVVSIYEGAYDPKGGTQVLRGFILPKDTGVYQCNPGYQDTFHCNQNAGAYMQNGEAMGKAMVELQKSTK